MEAANERSVMELKDELERIHGFLLDEARSERMAMMHLIIHSRGQATVYAALAIATAGIGATQSMGSARWLAVVLTVACVGSAVVANWPRWGVFASTRHTDVGKFKNWETRNLVQRVAGCSSEALMVLKSTQRWTRLSLVALVGSVALWLILILMNPSAAPEIPTFPKS